MVFEALVPLSRVLVQFVGISQRYLKWDVRFFGIYFNQFPFFGFIEIKFAL